MLATSLQLGTPHINTFSGKAMPGETEVSFEQRYQEVECVQDHYPESVVWESIMQSLKGEAVDIARYIGPTTSMAHILQKLMAPSFATLLEGTFNQIRLQCPWMIVDQEVQQYLKDCLFHRVCKHIRDLI